MRVDREFHEFPSTPFAPRWRRIFGFTLPQWASTTGAHHGNIVTVPRRARRHTSSIGLAAVSPDVMCPTILSFLILYMYTASAVGIMPQTPAKATDLIDSIEDLLRSRVQNDCGAGYTARTRARGGTCSTKTFQARSILYYDCGAALSVPRFIVHFVESVRQRAWNLRYMEDSEVLLYSRGETSVIGRSVRQTERESS